MALAASFSISLCGEKGGDAEWGCGCVFVQRASTARVAAPARRHMGASVSCMQLGMDCLIHSANLCIPHGYWSKKPWMCDSPFQSMSVSSNSMRPRMINLYTADRSTPSAG